MKFAFNPNFRGKPKQGEDHRLYYNGIPVNLGYGWETSDLSWDELFEAITEDGIATSSALKSDHRCEEEFVSRELVMIDIDKGMLIEDLLNDEFYNNNAAGFYTTPSHTDEAPRFRILFRTEEPITDPKRVRKLVIGLMMLFNCADPQCKDASRIFYGTINAKHKEKLNNFLQNETIDILVELSLLQQPEKEISNITYEPIADHKKKQIIDLLQKVYVGEYETWRNIGWGLKAGGFTVDDFKFVTTGMMNKKSSRDAEQIWNNGKNNGGITMGTVYDFLKKHYPETPWKIATYQDNLGVIKFRKGIIC